MQPSTRRTLERSGFLLSALLLVFVGGYLSRDLGWFPHSIFQTALGQGERILTSTTAGPDFAETRTGVSARVGATTHGDAGEIGPALTLITSTWRDFDWTPGLRLVDRSGRVLHEWRVEPTELFSASDHRRGTSLSEQDIHGSLLLPDGDIVVNVEYAGTARMDACGDVEWTVTEGNHHSIARAADGSFWIPGVSERRQPVSERYPDGYPGLSGTIFHSLILHVSPDGELLRTIPVLDVLYENDLERFIPKNDQQGRADVLHLNDVEPLSPAMAEEYPLFEAGDLLISVRNLDLVLVFDPDSLEVRWSVSRPFILQHDPDWMGDGWIGVLDNNFDDTERGTMLGGSRVVAVQPHTDSTTVLFPTANSDSFYTAHRGKWQQLEDGRLLLAESDEGRVLEAAPDGTTLWEWTAGSYDESSVPSVTRAARVALAPEDVAAWPCSPGAGESTAGAGADPG